MKVNTGITRNGKKNGTYHGSEAKEGLARLVARAGGVGYDVRREFATAEYRRRPSRRPPRRLKPLGTSSIASSSIASASFSL